jgi:hypothetical protein
MITYESQIRIGKEINNSNNFQTAEMKYVRSVNGCIRMMNKLRDDTIWREKSGTTSSIPFTEKNWEKH